MSMAVKNVKRVWEVCEPHPDVFMRDLDPSLFAISLHHVMQGTADKNYTDPERFFTRTFMTRALLDLLERVLGRLVGRERGAPILRLETPFGGGKTHTMTALYHIARAPQVVSEHNSVRPILERLNLRAIPQDIRVAVLDGRALNVQERQTGHGVTVRTLWGELAVQLGGAQAYEIVKVADQMRTSPGSELLTKLLGQFSPAIILMDEVLEYLVKARAVKVGDSNLMEQTHTFLGDLSAAVSAVRQTVLVVALPASSLEIGAESQEEAERLFQSTKKLLGRVELVEMPVAQDEVFGVLRQRLFKSIGTERDWKRAIEVFRDYYDQYQYARFFPDRVRTREYRDRMLQAYPFHPELVDLLYERWGPHPQFQRTRGALRLLALVLRRLWNQRPTSAFLIQPHHVDLADRHIRGEVIRLLDSGMDAVVTGDILQRAGDAEQRLGSEYAREQLGRGAATCAFLYSISAASRDVGATEEEIRTALLRPGINPAMVSEVLARLREELWYLWYRDRRYLFTARPNLNKVILDFQDAVTDEQVGNALLDWLARLAGKGSGVFQVVVAPAEPRVLPDRAQPTLVVLPLEVSDAKQWMIQAMQSAGEIRTNRNMLVFLVPDTRRAASIRVALKRWLALKEVAQSPSLKQMDEDDRDQVKVQLKDKECELEALLRQTYQDVYRPSDGEVSRVPTRTQDAIKAKTFDQYVIRVLEEAGVLLDRVAPTYIKDTLQVGNAREVPISQVINLFTGVAGQPILKDPQKAVQQAVAEGVKQGFFGLRVGEHVYMGQDVPEHILNDQQAVLVPPQTPPPTSLAVSTPKAVTLQVRTSAGLLYPLLKAAEKFKELREASVLLEVHDPTGQLAKLRAELEKLFTDYGCTQEWQEESK